MIPASKFCSRCETTKATSEFHLIHRREKERLAGYCKVCARELAKENSKQRYATKAGRAKKLAYQYSEGTLARRRSWKRELFARSPGHRAMERLQVRMSVALRRRGLAKSARVSESVGCSVSELRSHLESLFLPGMSWENYGAGPGNWNIDHILPVHSFDLARPDQFARCCHYSNLRPLWFEDNLARNDPAVLARELKSLGLELPVSA